jgi:DDB1- and CUL4-associated factor 7
MASPANGGAASGPAADVIEYTADTALYGLAWSTRRGSAPRVAVGSFVEEYSNKVEVLQQGSSSMERVCTFDHPYPATKIAWIPDAGGHRPELVGTTGDFLRIWEVTDAGESKLKCILNNNKQTEFCAPLTSFDWNEEDPSLIGTSSIDTTCTVWNVETQQAKTQLIAHDKEVYDFAFAMRGTDVFASVGADGSVRLFDLRSLEHSTIIYESPDLTPLLRLRWNKLDPNFLATVIMDSSKVIVLDIRFPSIPVAILEHKTPASPHNNVNAISWAPHTAVHLATAGDGCQSLIWDISHVPKRVEDPVLSYNARAPISNLQWSSSFPDWLAITVEDKLQLLRV